MTRILKVNPINPEKNKILSAVRILKKGGIVAFPTETVYGLGANAFNDKAVKKIFLAKNRPLDNPPIIHIHSIEQLKHLVKQIPPTAEKLIQKFWPGPLTIILKKSRTISDFVTTGLDTIAIRMPKNKIALELIKQAGFPIAAPSANLSGKPSTTSASHVIHDLKGKVDMVLDGGSSEIGLESTVISLVGEPILLRPGKISKEEIEEVIGKIKVHPAVLGRPVKKALSPGMKYRHYAPEAELILVQNAEKIPELKEKFESQGKKVAILEIKKLEKSAKELFNKLREFDSKGFDVILSEVPKKEGIGLAIFNRLIKASNKFVS